MWRTHKTPILFAVATLTLVLLSLATGLELRRAQIDTAINDTYYLESVMVFGALFAIPSAFSALFYLFFRRLIGVHYRRVLGISHWFTYSFGAVLILLTQLLIARTPLSVQYSDTYTVLSQVLWWNQIGYIVTLISAAIFAICLIEAIYRRIRSGQDLIEFHDDRADNF